MTTRKQSVIKILLFIARYINDDERFTDELKALSTHFSAKEGWSARWNDPKEGRDA